MLHLTPGDEILHAPLDSSPGCAWWMMERPLRSLLLLCVVRLGRWSLLLRPSTCGINFVSGPEKTPTTCPAGDGQPPLWWCGHCTAFHEHHFMYCGNWQEQNNKKLNLNYQQSYECIHYIWEGKEFKVSIILCSDTKTVRVWMWIGILSIFRQKNWNSNTFQTVCESIWIRI